MAQRHLGYYELPAVRLQTVKLPTVQEVLSHTKWLKAKEGKNLKLTKYFGEAVEHILELWVRCHIPVVTKRACVGRLNKWYINFEKWRKGTVTNHMNVSGRQHLSDNGFFQLFDIAKCGHGREAEPCGCPHADLIPKEMRSFYIDQYTTRNMDLEESAPNQIEHGYPAEGAASPTHDNETHSLPSTSTATSYERPIEPTFSADSPSPRNETYAGPSTSTGMSRYGRPTKRIAEFGFTSPGSTSSTIFSNLTCKDANYYQPESGEESGGSDTEGEMQGEEIDNDARSIIRYHSIVLVSRMLQHRILPLPY